jgi:hypothetical protein
MKRLLPFVISAVVTSVFFIDFCNWIYGCGCRSLWAGADASCNIHHASPPHCPWCSFGWAGYMGVWLSWLAPQLAVTLWGGKLRILWLAVVVPATGLLLAAALGMATGYWNHP